MDMEPTRVLKCQDPNPNWGMVTVGKELSTHLDTGKLNIFRLPAGVTPSQEAYAPCTRG